MPPSHHSTTVNGIRSHYMIAGSGPLVVLLHGWPQTAHAWRKVVPLLEDSYTLLAPDLRGFGYSSMPLVGYDASTVASDVLQLVERLGYQQWVVAGHDWGALVAYACAALERDRVTGLLLLDGLLPGVGALEKTMSYRFHPLFYAMDDLPEALIRDRERMYLDYYFMNYAPAGDPTAIQSEDIEEYLRSFRQPGGIRASIGYYRAIGETAEQFKEFAKEKLTIPATAWGADSAAGPLTKWGLEQVAADVHGGLIEGCGHWIPEERPQFVADELRVLCDRGEGRG
jgi:pimeloyl-ACP methyl ester carboxylesterase